MRIGGNKCAICAHNLDKTELHCEFHCAEVIVTKTDKDGTVYITLCNDYLKDTAEYNVTFEDEYTSGRKEKRICTIPVTGDGLAMTLQKIELFGLKLKYITRKG